MHIIIDIRDIDPLSGDTEISGEIFGKLWKTYFPHDEISFLILETQVKKSTNYFSVSLFGSAFFSKKLTASSKGNQVFRSVNFSLFPPYDRRIPTISHIFDNRNWLYPRGSEGGFFGKRMLEYLYRKKIKLSKKIIVPSMSVGLECMEIWQVREEKLEIVPYFSLRQNIITENTGLKYGIHAPFFLYDSGFGSESKLLDILKAFELYKEASGKNMLILHGSPLLELSHIIQIIRTFDLHDSVKLVSLLEPGEQEWLYKNAQAWIMVGGYMGCGPRIELAHDYHLPMILSDIPATLAYSGTRIHPNHIIDDLPEVLFSHEKKKHPRHSHEYNESDIIAAYKKHLAVK